MSPAGRKSYIIALSANKRPKRPHVKNRVVVKWKGRAHIEMWASDDLWGIRVSKYMVIHPKLVEFWKTFDEGAGPDRHKGAWELWWTPTTTALQFLKGRSTPKMIRPEQSPSELLYLSSQLIPETEKKVEHLKVMAVVGKIMGAPRSR